jgi:hypothetical protein
MDLTWKTASNSDDCDRLYFQGFHEVQLGEATAVPASAIMA